MKAISVRPPWAQFIIYGIPLMEKVDTGRGDGSYSVKHSGKVVLKDVENRKWKVPERFELPQRIYIHASKRDDAIEPVLDMCLKKLGLPVLIVLSMCSPKLGRGALLGTIELIDCIEDSKSPWAVPGQYHFVLRDPWPFKEPIPYRGQQRLFNVPDVEVPR